MHGCHTASGDDSHVLYIIFRPTFRRCSSLIVFVFLFFLFFYNNFAYMHGYNNSKLLTCVYPDYNYTTTIIQQDNIIMISEYV